MSDSGISFPPSSEFEPVLESMGTLPFEGEQAKRFCALWLAVLRTQGSPPGSMNAIDMAKNYLDWIKKAPEEGKNS